MGSASVEIRETRESASKHLPVDLETFLESVRRGTSGTYGYVSLLGLKTIDPVNILQAVERGLGFRTLERFQRNFSLSLTQLTQLIQIPPTTLIRRRQTGRLTPEESDRLMRAARLFAKALELFEGDHVAARKWLSTPQTALGGVRPLEVSKTEVGAREVESLIDRLEHGVIS
jgi:putative toxin-antitoxin system antitoxin component (TIGR02293 family)